MSILVKIEAEQLVKESYDKLREEVGWETNVPKGLILHLAAFDSEKTHAIDVWESEADFNEFFQSRLSPALEKLSLGVSPKIIGIIPIGSLFAPGIK